MVKFMENPDAGETFEKEVEEYFAYIHPSSKSKSKDRSITLRGGDFVNNVNDLLPNLVEATKWVVMAIVIGMTIGGTLYVLLVKFCQTTVQELMWHKR